MRLTSLAAGRQPICSSAAFRQSRSIPSASSRRRSLIRSHVPVSMWNPTPGLYTRYGAVETLLAEIDDRLVIMGSGDEIRLLFDAAALPPSAGRLEARFPAVGGRLGQGCRREHRLLANRRAAAVPRHEPVPLSGTETLPGQRDCTAHYREEYNTRPALRLLRGLAGDVEEMKRGVLLYLVAGLFLLLLINYRLSRGLRLAHDLLHGERAAARVRRPGAGCGLRLAFDPESSNCAAECFRWSWLCGLAGVGNRARVGLGIFARPLGALGAHRFGVRRRCCSFGVCEQESGDPRRLAPLSTHTAASVAAGVLFAIAGRVLTR